MIEKYNAYMGGADKSDQLLSYHNVLRKTLRYWKTLFYHMIDTAAVNAFTLYNLIATSSKIKLLLRINFETVLCYKLLPNMERMKGKKQLVLLVIQADLIVE